MYFLPIISVHSHIWCYERGKYASAHPPRQSPLRQTCQLSHPPGQLIDVKKKCENLPHADNDILRNMKENNSLTWLFSFIHMESTELDTSFMEHVTVNSSPSRRRELDLDTVTTGTALMAGMKRDVALK